MNRIEEAPQVLDNLVKILSLAPESEERLWPERDGCSLSVLRSESEDKVARLALASIPVPLVLVVCQVSPQVVRTGQLLGNSQLRKETVEAILKNHAQTLSGLMVEARLSIENYSAAVVALVAGQGDEATHRETLDQVGKSFAELYPQLNALYIRKTCANTWVWYREALNRCRGEDVADIPVDGLVCLAKARAIALQYDRRDRFFRLVGKRLPFGGLNRLLVWMKDVHPKEKVRERVMEEIGPWLYAVEGARKGGVPTGLFQRYLPYLLEVLPVWKRGEKGMKLVGRLEWAMKVGGCEFFRKRLPPEVLREEYRYLGLPCLASAAVKTSAVDWKWGKERDECFLEGLVGALSPLRTHRPEGKLEELVVVDKEGRVGWRLTQRMVPLDPAEFERFIWRCAGHRKKVGREWISRIGLMEWESSREMRVRIIRAAGEDVPDLNEDEEDAVDLLRAEMVKARRDLHLGRGENGPLREIVGEILQELGVVCRIPVGDVRDALIKKANHNV